MKKRPTFDLMTFLLTYSVYFSVFTFAIRQNEEFQRLDGNYNNLINIDFGSTGSWFYRNAPAGYIDGMNKINRTLPSPRILSNLIFKGESGVPSGKNATTMLTFFSELVKNEIMRYGDIGCPLKTLKIPVEKCDPMYDMMCEGNKFIPYNRAQFDRTTGKHSNSPREQLNAATAYIDGSILYGTSEPRLARLRTFVNGKLKESQQGYPPRNTDNIPSRNPAPPNAHKLLNPNRLFMLGNSLSNENPGILSLVIILFRWHNFNANRIHNEQPDWTDEQIFQAARRIVIASLQKIILYDFVPALLNNDGLSPYSNYKPFIVPGISHAFDIAFQFTKSSIPPAMFIRNKRKQCDFYRDIEGYSALRMCQHWWDAQDVVSKFGAEGILLGMTSQIGEREDNIIVEDIRDFGPGPMHFSRLDVVSSSIMRGRDNGLPPYNVLRRVFGLPPKTWETINEDFYKKHTEKIEKLKELYGGDINSLDAYVGGMLEGGESGPGEMFIAIIKDQFERIRDGDRFWFENRLNGLFNDDEIAQIRNITLRDIIKSTTDISDNMLQKNVFFFNEGDPCPQPFQINSTGLEKCQPLMIYSFWEGNDIAFVYTLIGLASVPFVCIAVAFYIVHKQKQIGYNQCCDGLTTTFSNEDPDSKIEIYKVNALEWLHEEHIRQVRIEIENSVLTIKKPRGNTLSCIRFKQGQKIKIVHSTPRSSKLHGPFVLISHTQNDSLVVRLPTDLHLSTFLDNITTAVKSVNGELTVESEENTELLSRAITRERRQDRLDNFFREAYARAFNDNELSDQDTVYDETDPILNETISREELASAMQMKSDNEFVRRMFAMTARHNEDTISFKEFLDFLRNFVNASQREKFRFLFKMCDLNGDNRVLRNDFADLLRATNESAGVMIDKTRHDNLIDSIMCNAGSSQNAEYLDLLEFDAIFDDTTQNLPSDLKFGKVNVQQKTTLGKGYEYVLELLQLF